jgi:sulfur carrier protein
MQILINGKIKHFEIEAINLIVVLRAENITSLQGIAVAVNETVVPKLQWEQFLLSENDSVTIIKAVQGG